VLVTGGEGEGKAAPLFIPYIIYLTAALRNSKQTDW